MGQASFERSQRNAITASELVRQFGIWQEQAAREPIYITHRGRPRLVLASVDLMDRLCSTRAASSSPSIEHALLLDIMREPVFRVDSDGLIQAVNPAGAAWIGRDPDSICGVRLSRLLGEALGGYCDALVRRACRFASIETAEIPHGDHRMTLMIAPLSPGALIVGIERTAQDDGAGSAEAARQALIAASAIAGSGHCRLNLRGHVEAADGGFSELSGLPADVVLANRFVSLFTVGSRVAVGDTVDAVMRDGEPRSADGILHRNRGADLPVRIGIAPLRPRVAIEGAIATIRSRTD